MFQRPGVLIGRCFTGRAVPVLNGVLPDVSVSQSMPRLRESHRNAHRAQPDVLAGRHLFHQRCALLAVAPKSQVDHYLLRMTLHLSLSLSLPADLGTPILDASGLQYRFHLKTASSPTTATIGPSRVPRGRATDPFSFTRHFAPQGSRRRRPIGPAVTSYCSVELRPIARIASFAS